MDQGKQTMNAITEMARLMSVIFIAAIVIYLPIRAAMAVVEWLIP